MSTDNPYAPPKADVSEFEEIDKGQERLVLANRSTRFLAQFVDGLIAVAIGIPIILMLGIWRDLINGQQPSFPARLASNVLAFCGFVLIHGYFLKHTGQTIGKKLCAIRIVDHRGDVPDLATLLFRRYLPVATLSLIPVLGPLLSVLDVVFIFGEDRRCVHDLVAGTWVVKRRTQR